MSCMYVFRGAGRIPTEIGQLAKLVAIRVGGNTLTGSSQPCRATSNMARLRDKVHGALRASSPTIVRSHLVFLTYLLVVRCLCVACALLAVCDRTTSSRTGQRFSSRAFLGG